MIHEFVPDELGDCSHCPLPARHPVHVGVADADSPTGDQSGSRRRHLRAHEFVPDELGECSHCPLPARHPVHVGNPSPDRAEFLEAYNDVLRRTLADY